jgi:tetratricopeptide (TPR) repeat protein
MAPRRNRLAPSLLALVVPAVVLGTVVAWGQGEPSGGKKKSDTSAAASRDYSRVCAQGNAKYGSHDFDGAIELYRKAIELSPHQALAHYLLGEAQLAAGNFSDAEASWSRGLLETGEKDPVARARFLFVMADIKEREKKWEDAKAAWQTYLDWVSRFPDGGAFFPASALSRQRVIDTMLKQDKSYEVVRQRIAATADGGVFSDPSKSPPSAK